jgi:hypothetical protein
VPHCLNFIKSLVHQWHLFKYIAMKKIIVVLLLNVLIGNQIIAQRKTTPAPTTRAVAAKSTPKEKDESVDYSSVLTFGATTNTSAGLLGGFVLRKADRLDNTLFGKTQFRYLALELVNVRHPKELPTPSGTGERFTPGKQNYLFVLRPQYGREIVLSSRNGDEGIAINGILAAGLSLGIAKPYYVRYQVRPGITKTEPYDPATQSLESILGKGGFFQGLDQAQIVPGINLKAALSFELSAFRSNLTGIEVGFLAEILSKKVIIMPFADNKSTFTSAYITVYFGSKK